MLLSGDDVLFTLANNYLDHLDPIYFMEAKKRVVEKYVVPFFVSHFFMLLCSPIG